MTPAERLADAILRAAGSSLSRYSMHTTRAAIVAAAEEGLRAQWQPIETAPKDGIEVLLFGPLRDGSGTYCDVSRFFRGRWPVEWMDNCLAPTHWMPLPPPPALENPHE